MDATKVLAIATTCALLTIIIIVGFDKVMVLSPAILGKVFA